MNNKIIVIGDLHGDYYKLVRILQEKNIAKIIETGKEIEVNIYEDDTYLVFVGDYIDWRGETLENPYNLDYSELVKGTSKIIKLISLLLKKRKNVFALIGNHEDMMFKGLNFLKNFSLEEINDLLEKIEINPYLIMKNVIEKGLLEDFITFYNWYSQGGMNTIKSFENIENFIKAVEEKEIFKNLLLFLYFQNEGNQKILISHSFPDKLDCIQRIVNNNISKDDVIYILWSRKIWGIDAFNATKTEPFEENEIINTLEKNGIEKYIIGHTRVSFNKKPLELFKGKIVNVDNHGIPLAEPFILENLIVKSYYFRYYKDFL